jgi:hypothetical protein
MNFLDCVVVKKNRDVLRKTQTIQFVDIIPYGDISKKYFKVFEPSNVCVKKLIDGCISWERTVFFLDNHAIPIKK